MIEQGQGLINVGNIIDTAISDKYDEGHMGHWDQDGKLLH
jgi:hypothetical protein